MNTPLKPQLNKHSVMPRYQMIQELISKWESELKVIEFAVKSGSLSKLSEFEHKSRYITIQEIIEDLKKLNNVLGQL
jgi:hypothetical protein